jgi:hypothetical protein
MTVLHRMAYLVSTPGAIRRVLGRRKLQRVQQELVEKDSALGMLDALAGVNVLDITNVELSGFCRPSCCMLA